MGNVIATNVSSLNAQRQLAGTNSALGTTFQRLSSGFRINSAKDDAAGLQISNRLSSQISGLGVAARNANDGISLAQTAEGALQESTNILQRMRNLAIQSANGSNGSSERAALQQEVAQLQAELNRIADTTRFGSKTLLDGSFGTQTFQVGAQAYESITVATGDARAKNIGSYQLNFDLHFGYTEQNGYSSQLTGAMNANINQGVLAGAQNKIAGGTLTIRGALGTASAAYVANATAKTVAENINAVSDQTGVSASARTNVLMAAVSTSGLVSFDLISDNSTAVAISANMSTTTDFESLANAINKVTAETGVYARIENGVDVLGTTRYMVLTNESGNDINLMNLNNSAGGTAHFFIVDYNAYIPSGTFVANSPGATIALDGANDVNGVGLLQFNSSRAYTVQASNANDWFNVTTPVGAGLATVSAIDISSAEYSQIAIGVLDQALQAIDSLRGDLGAVQNRFQSTISNLNNVAENASAARSRIRDTDYAMETANLAKNQVLLQAGLAVLAQANASSQSILSLLQ